MKFLSTSLLRLFSILIALCCFAAERQASGQECPLVFPASPSNDLTAYITSFPYETNTKQALISTFIVDVTNIVTYTVGKTTNSTNYINPPIPYGLYPAWCIDGWDDIKSLNVTVPGALFTGALYSSCDPNLNNELPPGHTNTLVSSTNWQMINYILNHPTYDGTNAFYWSVAAAINTLIGNGMGSLGACGVVLTTPLPQGSLPDGSCGYPSYNTNVVEGLLTAASNNYASWVPQCGDVYGAVYVTQPLSASNQFLVLEVPVPCSPCINITKQVACLQPNNSCGQFGSVAQGFAGDCPGAGTSNNPAFCYEITITNCGTIPLTNLVVSDNLMGNLTTNFFTNSSSVFEPGAAATVYFSMSFATNATNTVVVQGDADLAGSITNGAEVITNGTSVSATATATALVTPASISCGLTLYSPLNLDAVTNGNDVQLPAASYFSTPPSISFSIEICAGAAAVDNVNISAPALAALGLTLPSAFNLAPGQCTNFALGSANMYCSNQTYFSVATTGTVEPDANHCGVYDLTGSPVYVCSSCVGTVECSTTNGPGGCVGGVASVSGTVALNCMASNTNLSGDSPLSGIPVVLFGADNNSLATNITDVKGDYSFTNLAAGSYVVAVEAPTNYVETYPSGVTNGEISVIVVSCQDLSGVNFGYADTTPPLISIPGLGQYLGCNAATNLPSNTNLATNVTAIVSCGTPNIVVTNSITSNGCLYTATYVITVTDTYGNMASTNVVYTWTVNTTPPAILGTPTNSYLGCNPLNTPTSGDVTNGMSATSGCGTATLSVTNSLTNTGCLWTNTFTITAIDNCGNTSSTNVIYTWTVNTTPPAILGTPTNSYLGCNPLSTPASGDVTNGMSATSSCGTANLSATNSLTNSGCLWTNTFTITAIDNCGNTSSTNVVYTWTVNTTPPAILGTPTNSYLGCNPLSTPTSGSVTNGMSATSSCGTATLSVTNLLANGGCLWTNTFTITAIDNCGNTSSTNVVYTWTINTTPPAILGTPTNSYLGCNPLSTPTSGSVTNGMSATSSCGTATLSVTNLLANGGCLWTNTFTITAIDNCGNTSSTNVVYTWTINTTPPAILGTPTNSYLGCNPLSTPTSGDVTNGMSATSGCGTATLSVTNLLANGGCLWTNTFTITAIDNCGNTSSTNVVYTWTVNTTPPAILGTPTNSYLGCNPLSTPTSGSVTNGMSATSSCGTANLSVTNLLANGGCLWTNTFTITAIDNCGNTSSTNVVYTWTINTTPPAILGTPTNSYLGCNPLTTPTCGSVTNGMSATSSCGTANLSVTNLLANGGCLWTNTFTITATDNCGNTSSTNVVYTWTVNTTPPAILGTPTNSYLGCNPLTTPTGGSVTNGMSATSSCGTATLSVTNLLANGGCLWTNTFTITAIDNCGNTSSTNVVYTWTVNTTPPAILGTPTNSYLGCNPLSTPTSGSVTNGMSATSSCGTATLSVTNLLANGGCLWTNTFTITAIDNCGNTSSTNVVYTWTINTTPPAILGTPTNSYLGCNPLSTPTSGSVTNGMSATSSCGSANLSVTNLLTSGGCLWTNTFTITAIDNCGNTSSTNVVYTWTVNTTPPAILGTPTNNYLGCNPASLPTCGSVTNGMSATSGCGSATLGVTSAMATNGCFLTNTFTVKATDGCGNTSSTNVVYSWTANTSAPVIRGTPTNSYLGCNPASLPTCASVVNGVSASNACGSATLGVTSTMATNGCFLTNTFTIKATDGCGNTSSTNVVYSWTANTGAPVIRGTPTNSYLGCNPASLPTCASVVNGVTASNACGSATLSATSVLTTNGCYLTNTFTIKATDNCGNTASTNVVYSWTANTGAPVIRGTPTNSYLGCNPASLPTCASVVNGVTASNACGSATLSATSVMTTNGCYLTNTFTIKATSGCGNTASTNVVYSWTANTGAPVIRGTPTNSYLGCNPASLPTCASVVNGVSASNACGSASLSATSVMATNGCYLTNTFTIKATDNCGNTSSTNVVYSWTANTTAPVIRGTPTNSYLGCNPASLPTCTSVISGVSASNACGSATLSATSVMTTNGCYLTNTFTIKATSGCGNTASTNVVYSWTANTTPPVIHGAPTNSYLGCNPESFPTALSVTNGMSASATCGSASLSVTSVMATNGCFLTNTFTIKATDGCGNTSSTNVVYSWLANLAGPTVTCPPSVTIVTNICQMYCTYTAGDWGGSCNGGYRYNNSWWNNWCGNNQTSQCFPSFTNWWNSCGASSTQCSTWWNNWNNSHPTNWWGCWSGNQQGNWYNSWNNCNYGSQNFVPCGGNNPDSTLNNCFSQVYPNGCVRVGCTNGGGNCVSFSSCSAVQTCLNWSGTPGVLNNCSTNPSSCNAGSFCAQVVALQLNCDFGDYGCAPGFVGKCGDLVLCNPASPCNGLKVRDVLKACNCALGGGACPQGCSVQYLCGLCSNLNQCFEGCQVSGWCNTNLCSVYIPTPAQTGTASVSDTCSPNPTLTYSDTVAQATCGATYVISREWMAVDACGNSNTCTQLITVAQSNSCSLSGLVVLACGGDSNLNNNEGIAGATVTLESSTGATLATTTTDANGNYSFESLAPAGYIVVVTPPSGYTETYPAASGNKTNVVVAACQNLAGVNFAYVGSTIGVQLTKTAPCNTSCGGAITYTFAVTNTGNTCETLSVVDPMLGGTIFSQTSVAPGQGFLFTSNYTVGSAACMLTNTASAIGTSNGKSVTNTSSVVTCITTKCVTNQVCGSFNSQNPGNGYVWCNAHLTCNPGKACTVYCQNATVTFSCQDGKSYTFPVPDCQVNFANCSSGSSSFNGTCWNTTLPCAGDSQIFLSGCGIPWQSDFANCQSVCWTGTFSCSAPNVNCSWQWGAACYNNGNLGNCGNVSVKACQQTSCGYNNSDCAGTPENCKSSCQTGGCGYGGNNYCGSFSDTGSFTCH